MKRINTMKKIWIALLAAIILSNNSGAPVYAATTQTEETSQPDIIDESKAQREKLRQSITNAEAILESSSGTRSSKDSLSVIRHSSGTAPSSYRPHGQRDMPIYDTSRVYSSGNTGSSNVYSVEESSSVGAMDTVDANPVVDTTVNQPASANTGASTALVPSPITSAAPITSSSKPSVNDGVSAIYSLIPEAIRNDYEQNGWVIKIVPDDEIRNKAGLIGMIPGFIGTVAGLTVIDENTIYLNDKYAEEAIGHEMGHYVDIVLLGSDDWPPSFSDEFNSIYESEKETFRSNYPKSDPSEYFAETFGLYIEYAADLKKDFPKTYEYMDRLISPFGGTTTLSRSMTEAEKTDRYGFDFTEVIKTVETWKKHISEVKKQVEAGMSTPAANRFKNAGKGLIDSVKNGIMNGVKNSTSKR